MYSVGGDLVQEIETQKGPSIPVFFLICLFYVTESEFETSCTLSQVNCLLFSLK